MGRQDEGGGEGLPPKGERETERQDRRRAVLAMGGNVTEERCLEDFEQGHKVQPRNSQ